MDAALRIFLLATLSAAVFLPDRFSEPSLKVRRILSLSPAETQNLAYLGLEDKLVGVSVYDQHPAVQNLPKLGGINASDESILRLNPDMILVSETSAFDHLKSRGVRVHASQTGSLRAVYSNLRFLEKFFGMDHRRSEEFWRSAQKPKGSFKGRYILALSLNPMYTMSTNTFLSELLAMAGWENAVQTEASYPVLGEESLSRMKADRIFIPQELLREGEILEQLRRRMGADQVTVLSNQELFLPSPFLTSDGKVLEGLEGL